MTTLVSAAPGGAMFETVACLACRGRSASFFIAAEDDLTGRPGRFTFVRCDACGLVYQQPRLRLPCIKPFYETDYIAHQSPRRWGALGPLFRAAVASLDRTKLRLVSRFVHLSDRSSVLDVGCGTGSFLAMVRARTGARVVGVDFVDLGDRAELAGVEFHHGVFGQQEVGAERFDLVTMWHFLEHDYDPAASLAHARAALAPGGTLVIEVPRLDSWSFRLFTDRWPGLQAPQHTAVYDKASLLSLVERNGLRVDTYLPYGAFPPYFYLFCGIAFRLRRGKGLNLDRSLPAYFAGQLALLPLLPILKHANFAMQTVVCRRPS
jgi:2-polyprenyl-3-methyl-5-hydroxy-6-metoxy-1,4-benzoquinol methylase